jgi:hypothetical protein
MQVVSIDDNFSLSPETVADSGAMKRLLGSNFSPDAALARAVALLKQTATAVAPPWHVNCRCWLQPFVSEVLVREQIGDALAGQFFAQVDKGVYRVSYG